MPGPTIGPTSPNSSTLHRHFQRSRLPSRRAARVRDRESIPRLDGSARLQRPRWPPERPIFQFERPVHLNGAWGRDLLSGRRAPEVMNSSHAMTVRGLLFSRLQLNFRVGRDEIDFEGLTKVIAVSSVGMAAGSSCNATATTSIFSTPWVTAIYPSMCSTMHPKGWVCGRPFGRRPGRHRPQ